MFNIGERIKALRKKEGLTMEQLAERVGVSKVSIHKWEAGKVDNMKSSHVNNVAKAFGVSPAYLLGFEDKQAFTVEVERPASSEERMLVYLYKLLSEENKARLVETINRMITEQGAGNGD